MNQVLRHSLRKTKILLLISLLIGGYNILHSQSLSVFDVDQSAFPTIKAKFYAFDKDGKQVTNFSPADFQVKEDGVERKVTFVSCPEPKPPVALSSVLVFDVSGSMSEGPPRIQSAKDAANAWVEGLPKGNSECALVSFSDNSMILHDFTKDKNKLKKSIEELVPTSGTNYNQALIDPPAGGLQIAKTRKYKKVLILLTDGLPNFEPKTQEIIDFANQNDITIYAITLDLPAPQCIKNMTLQTGGQYFENITTKQEAEEIYHKLLKLTQGVGPCEIEWKGAAPCKVNCVNAVVKWNGVEERTSYVIPKASVAELIIEPHGVYFRNKPVGISFDTTIKVTAINSDFVVTDIVSSDPSFDITPKNFTLAAGESRVLNLRFTPPDSSNYFSKFEFINNQCEKYSYAAATNINKKLKNNTLKVVSPNGGEIFIVGSDTVITWEGVLPEDTVKIEYSFNNGKTWSLLTDQATGLSYKWRNIPNPVSDSCLIRISTSENSSNIVPGIEWQKCLGGWGDDRAFSIIQTHNGDYVVAGYVNYGLGDVTGFHSYPDFWIVKLDRNGQIVWKNCIGGNQQEIPKSIIETSDGGFAVAGSTYSNDGDVTGNHGSSDAWVVKLNSDGQIQWQKCYGASDLDDAQSMQETSDGGFIICGYSKSKDGDVTGNHGYFDFWIFKIDLLGQLEWQKCFGGSRWDQSNSIIQTSLDGGYIAVGWTDSNDGDVTSDFSSTDGWIVKLDHNGQMLWQKCIGGNGGDEFESVIETKDHYFVVTGRSISNDGDYSVNHGSRDFWVVKLDYSGQVLWQKLFGGRSDECATTIDITSDGGYIISGTANSDSTEIPGSHSNRYSYLSDLWIVKLNKDGILQWQKCIGGNVTDGAESIKETFDGGYIIAGMTCSTDGDVSGKHNDYDYWVVKLNPEGLSQSDISDSVFSIVMPQPAAQDIDLKQCLVGSAKDSLISGFISNTGSYKCRVDSIYFTGADASAFSLVSGIPPYEIMPGGSHSVEFRFKPGRVGIHLGQVVIITQADTLGQNIRGEGVQPLIALADDFIDFGAVPIGEARDTLQALTIRNVGTNPVEIISTKHVFPNDKDFATLKGAGPFTLQPGETAKMDLRFTPTEIGRTNGCLEFNFNGPGSPAVVRLFGQGLGGAVIVSSDSAYAGEKRKLRLTLGNSIKPKAESLITKYKAKLSYNKTMLTMTEPGAVKSFDDYYETSEVTSGWDGSSPALGEFEVMAGLGNSDTTDLIIDEFSWLNEKGEPVDFETETTNGIFRLLGVCREGGARLVNPDGEEAIKGIYPNPSKDEIIINFEISEKSYSRIYITNVLGEKVKDVYSDNNPELGEQSVSINVNNLSSGTYYIVLETMNGCQGKRIEVVR